MAHSTDVAGFPVARAYLADRCPSRRQPLLFETLRRNAMQPGFLAEGEAVSFSQNLTPEPSEETDQRDDDVTVSLVEQLALILGLAAALGDTRLPRRSCAELRVSDAGLLEALEVLTEFDRVRDMMFETRPDKLALVDLTNAADEGRRARRQRDIDHALRAGETVFAVTTTPAQLDASRRARLDRTLIVPPSGRRDVRALMRLIHPNLPVPDSDALLGDDAVRRLASIDVARAVVNAPREPIAEALDQLVRALVRAGGPTLDDVKGHEAVKAELTRLQADIAAWQGGDLAWRDIPNGFLFHGPPGTGKTLLAQAFAGSAGLPITITSYGEAIAAPDRGSLGPTLAKLFEAVEEARRQAPAVLFLDELDGFGSRESAVDHNSSYQRGLVTGFLRLIDTVRGCPGIVLIGATNSPGALDPAARRPGRFDRLIEIGLPAKHDIVALLRSDLPTASCESLAAEADHLLGMSPAQISNLMRQAAGQARAERREITPADLSAVRQQELPLAGGLDLVRVAAHEAGHLLVGHRLGLDLPDRVVVSPNGSSVGFQIPQVLLPATLDAALATICGGRAAERILFAEISSGSGAGPGSDLSRATTLAFRAEAGLHLEHGSDLIWHDPEEAERMLALDRDLRDRVSTRLKRAEASALEVLRQHRRQLEHIAQVCLDARELDRDALETLLRDSADASSTSPKTSHHPE